MSLTKSVKQGRLFYGWVIVAVMFVTSAMSMAMGGLNFGLFIKPMGDELGIGRAAFGWASTARQVVGAVTSPTLGKLIDRYGTRFVLPVTISVTAIGLLGLSLVTNSGHLIGIFAFMGIAGLGGGNALVTSVPIAKWFVSKRGRAMSYVSLGLSIGGIIFVPLTQVLIDAVGWRHAWLILGILGPLVVIPLAIIFLRRHPEDMGLRPDGEPSIIAGVGASGAVRSAADAEVQWTLKESIRTRTFWQLLLTFSLVTLGQSTVGLHRIPHFMDRGLDPGLVAFASIMDTFFAGVSILGFGVLVRKVQPRFLGAAGFLIIIVAIASNIFTYTPVMMFWSFGVWGLGVGVNILLQNYLWADYFGRQNVGAIRGIVMPVTLFFGGIGGPIAGYVRDNTGSYDSIWWAGIALMALAAITLALSAPPRKQTALAAAAQAR
ncbi:MAG: MFS transporter [Dehalococcoidia bacterium]|nr:MFS transporter [Dehalococcoidia bacterium]